MKSSAPASAAERLRWSGLSILVGLGCAIFLGQLVLVVAGTPVGFPTGDGAEAGRTAGQLLVGRGFESVQPSTMINALASAPLWIGLLGVPLWARSQGLDWARDLRWGWKWSDLAVGSAAGLVLQLLVVPLMYLPFRSLIDFEKIEAPARALVDRANSPLDAVVLVAWTVFGAAIIEEIFFRGLFLGALLDRYQTNRYGVVIAVAGSSLLFATLHLQVIQFPALLVVGVAHAGLRLQSDRLARPIASHVAFNAAALAALAFNWTLFPA